jgi:hypothetical protein
MHRLLLLCTILSSPFLHAQQINMHVSNASGPNTPVFVDIKKPNEKNAYGLYNPATKKIYPLQWYDQQHAIFILTDSVPAGKDLNLNLKKIKLSPSPFKTITTSAGIEIRVKDKPVLFYHTAIANPPADSPAYYKRSGFIHPLYSPAGTTMTDDFPSNHAHQHGLFHAWTNNTYKKQHVDFWNQHQKTGTIQHKQVVSMSDGPVFSELKTIQEYVSLQFGVVLSETWTIRIYPFTEQFMFDLQVEQTNITSDTLYLNKYIYGGMAFRGSREWDSFNKQYYRNPWNVLTSEGYKDSLGNNTAARWVTAFGNINGIMSATTVFNHSGNIRYPQKVRIHPNMPYWVYAPVIDGDMFIAPGRKYNASYRYLTGNKTPDNNLLERINENYIHPPEQKVK